MVALEERRVGKGCARFTQSSSVSLLPIAGTEKWSGYTVASAIAKNRTGCSLGAGTGKEYREGSLQESAILSARVVLSSTRDCVG